MSTTLGQLVDLALGTPEVGAVNFNALHTLLHGMLNKLKLTDSETNFNPEDRELLATKKSEAINSDQTGLDSRDGKDADVISQKRSPYHQLENAVSKLQEQLTSLNDLPNNTELFERARAKGDGERSRPVTDMWQALQMSRRVDANEAGIGKLMSLVEDMMQEVQQLRDTNADLQKKLETASDTSELLRRLREVEEKSGNAEDLKNRLNELESKMNELNDQLSQYPNPDKFEDFVTWTSLEEALKGIRNELQPAERVVIEMSSQTEPKSVTPEARPVSSMSRASTPGPSADLQEILEKLGRLTNQHDVLEDRVIKLEEEMPNKMDKNALSGLSVPDELLSKLKDLQDQMAALQKTKDKLEQLDVLAASVDDLRDVVDSMDVDHLKALLEALNHDMNSRLADVEGHLRQLEELVLSGGPTSPEVAARSEHAVRSESVKQVPPDQSPDSESGKSSPEAEINQDKLLGLEHALLQNDSEMKQLDKKMKYMNQDSNRQLQALKDKLAELETELRKLAELEAKLEKHTLSPIKSHRSMTRQDVQMDHDALARMQKVVSQLQEELKKVTSSTQSLLDDQENKQKHIDTLYSICSKLEENKADKDYVQMEVDVKADKRLVDGKVNRSVFDSTCDELTKMINDMLSKLLNYETDWKSALEQLNSDVDGKLDRLEFSPIKSELERQLKLLRKQLGSLEFHGEPGDDDAAGLRKQLLRYHCISCDRPVDLMQQGTMPSIPAPNALPATRSARPYTTFEIEQIRQHAKSGTLGTSLTNFDRAVMERQIARCRMHYCHNLFMLRTSEHAGCIYRKHGANAQPTIDVMDMYATQRACGGSHTLTYPHRRITRMTQMNNLFPDEEPAAPPVPLKEEIDIQGADGHIYRGRLPNLVPGSSPNPPSGNGSPKLSRKGTANQMRMSSPSKLGHLSPRPTSARMSRPGSARGGAGSRPQSANPPGFHTTAVPTGFGTSSPPPVRAPAPSERDPLDPLNPITPTPSGN